MNYKKIAKISQIPEIELPKVFEKEFNELANLSMETILNTPKEKMKPCGIPMPKIPTRLRLAHSFFYWVTDLNGVIRNLNIVLQDLRLLATKAQIYRSNQIERIYLLVRLFFYEIFRLREIHSSFIKDLFKQGLIYRDEQDSLRVGLHERLENLIETRNRLVHSKVIWVGKEHLKLTVIRMLANSKDDKLNDQCSIGISLRDALMNCYNRWVPDLFEEGCHASSILQHASHVLSERMAQRQRLLIEHGASSISELQ